VGREWRRRQTSGDSHRQPSDVTYFSDPRSSRIGRGAAQANPHED
jgi:hypothetical protein